MTACRKFFAAFSAVAILFAALTSTALCAEEDGWQRKNGRWYYYQSGTPLTGWLSLGDAVFWLGENGEMATGWQDIDSRRYYFTAEGVMAWGGWIETEDGWHYLYDSGEMAKDTAIGPYTLDTDGVCAVSDDNTPDSTAQTDWVGCLAEAQDTDQLLIVAASGTRAKVSFHLRDENGRWQEQFSVDGSIGANGLGKTKAGDKKTPVGVYHFTDAFGIYPDPGSRIPYTQVDDSYWWIGDSASPYYNRFISTNDLDIDFKKADSEHIISYTTVYNYVLALDYNKDCTPYVGSAIFLHCWRGPGRVTGGCVAIPEENMIQVLQAADGSCAVIIDTPENIRSY